MIQTELVRTIYCVQELNDNYINQYPEENLGEDGTT